jgi:hypothetical protein
MNRTTVSHNAARNCGAPTGERRKLPPAASLDAARLATLKAPDSEPKHRWIKFVMLA